jgi:periplasmic divalent cation tolerance protein
MDAKAILIMTTVDSEALAATLATKLLELRQAACVQQVDIRSRYRWDGDVKCDTEILLLVKTSTDAADAAMRTVRESHSYEVPEIVALPISGGLPAYLDWVAAEASSREA